MWGQAVGLIFCGGFLIGVRPGLPGCNNILHLVDNKKFKYNNIKGFNYLLFSGVEYQRNPSSPNIQSHYRYRFSLRPLKVYHNEELVYRDCFVRHN